jgi:hypothetical protein
LDTTDQPEARPKRQPRAEEEAARIVEPDGFAELRGACACHETNRIQYSSKQRLGCDTKAGPTAGDWPVIER